MPDKNRKLVTAAAFTVALGLGGLAGATLITPASAQTSDDTTTDDSTTDAPAREGQGFGRRGPGGPGHHGPKLDAAAEVIGVSVDDLREALRDGQTLAEVATANGVDPQAVIDALVADATERITDFVNNGKPERPADAPDADAEAEDAAA